MNYTSDAHKAIGDHQGLTLGQGKKAAAGVAGIAAGKAAAAAGAAVPKTNPVTKQYKVDKVVAPAVGGFGSGASANVKWK